MSTIEASRIDTECVGHAGVSMAAAEIDRLLSVGWS